MAFDFTKDLETGHSLIDSEHRQLIKAINDLMDACAKGQGRTELAKTTKFLADYTAKHFADEEKLQLQYQYPDYPNHKRYHEEFKRVVAEIGEQLQKDGPTIVLVGKVNTNIGAWFLNHIKREDTKLAAHIRNSK